ncbi:MAG TPA: DUF1902 domain-containing protein [Devosia sp.]|nr:DUF1902 domain-containing protein [Devosia sp.]
MQKLPIDIIAEWDPEASVWVATSEDIGGFVMEDATIERLISRIPDVLEDLIELNNVELPAGMTEVPFQVHALQTGFAVARRA